MKRSHLFAIAALVALSAGVGIWLAQENPPHQHQIEKRTDALGQVYYTCSMHPQVRQAHPGNCPICGMQLTKKEEKPASQEKVLYWYDPMKPEVHFDKPGKSPFMDMDLVPKYAGTTSEQQGTVEIDPRMVQNLGVRTAKVEGGSSKQNAQAVGTVEVDERRIVAIESRASGWVEKLAIKSVGEPVKRGQRVAGVYSPDLFAAQQELALAGRSGDQGLISATRQRLSFLGFSADQIESVVRTGKPERQVAISSPTDGVVIELNTREGQQVSPGMPLMRVADLSKIWIGLELPEVQAGSLIQGAKAQVRLAALSGKSFEGTVDYVYPKLDTQTRTVRARIALDNAGRLLRPGMFAEVTLLGGPQTEGLSVPSEAVIRTGERTVVILAEGAGRFRPALVKAGEDRGGRTEILEGLTENDTVVVSGQFLIDSEASLQGVLARMSAPPTESQE